MTEPTVQPTGYWTFFCAPRSWNPETIIGKEGAEIWYRVADYQAKRNWFSIGDKGVIRVGVDQRSAAMRRGRPKLYPSIFAFVEVTSLPEFVADNELGGYNNEHLAKLHARVRIKISRDLSRDPIALSHLPSEVTDNFLIKGFQASSMPLNPLSYKSIVAIIDAAGE